MKQKKGISLIVLVITIIIMIIIAGAIILSLTETNIIDQAETAVNKYNETELKQRVGLVFTEAQMAKYTDLEYSIENNLKSIFEGIYGKDNITVAKSGKNYKVNLKDSKTTFRIKPDGNIQEYEEMDPTNVYARLDDEGILYLRVTEKEGYNLYTDYRSIQSNWNTAGDATPASVVKVIIEEKIAPTIANSMFANMSNLEKIQNIQNFHTENITDMAWMFAGCINLTNIDLATFDTNKVTSMSNMFCACKNLINLDLSSFDTSETMWYHNMFYGCTNIISIDVTSFNINKVKRMDGMFRECVKLTNIDISNFYTGSDIVNIGGMFAHCNSLEKIDLGNFDTTKITSGMNDTFYNCKNLKNLKLGNKFVINEGVNIDNILYNVPIDIKITATEATRDKLISASSLTEDNFEIIN